MLRFSFLHKHPFRCNAGATLFPLLPGLRMRLAGPYSGGWASPARRSSTTRRAPCHSLTYQCKGRAWYATRCSTVWYIRLTVHRKFLPGQDGMVHGQPGSATIWVFSVPGVVGYARRRRMERTWDIHVFGPVPRMGAICRDVAKDEPKAALALMDWIPSRRTTAHISRARLLSADRKTAKGRRAKQLACQRSARTAFAIGGGPSTYY